MIGQSKNSKLNFRYNSDFNIWKKSKNRFKSKKSDLNQKNPIFSIFCQKIMIFCIPVSDKDKKWQIYEISIVKNELDLVLK